LKVYLPLLVTVCGLPFLASTTHSAGPEQVDLLITHGTVVVMDEHNTIFPNGVVAVKNDTIIYNP